MAQFQIVDWLLEFLIYRIHEFEWDQGNALKNLEKHGIKKLIIEAVFQDPKILALGKQVTPAVEEDRFGVIAKSLDDKILFICFTIRNQKIRPISGRLANEKERLTYDQNILTITSRI